ncbi:MAG TPA: GNAT family N-acetyltransferase [Anaerolineae bacterium]|nr:GNAT family N-acetyltransferase [Anaerolineae bacterium]
MSEIFLREASVSDAATIVSILQTAFQEYRALLDPPSGVHKESVESIVAKMKTACWVIGEVDGTAVGCVMYEKRDDYMYLGRLAVLPEFRRRGVGKSLIEYVEVQARASHIARVRLGVRIVLEELRASYARRGYREIGFHAHEGYTEPTYVTMEKDLTLRRVITHSASDRQGA